jgi:DNA-binding CsgD family transcriptional regulator
MEGAQGRPSTLSRREMEVAGLVAEGLTNRAIAERMFISERTVDGHLEHIREKLGVSSRAQVATWYIAQPPPSAAIPGAPAKQLPRLGNRGRWLSVAAVAVVALVAGAVVYERMTPASPAGPAITVFSSKNPVDQLFFPWAVAVAPDGLVYVADRGDLAIRKVDPIAGSISTFAGGIPPTTASFVDGRDRLSASVGFVSGLAVAPDGTGLYFANGFMVGRVAIDGTLEFVAGSRSPPPPPGNTTGLKNPVGLAFSPGGSLYIADLVGNQVWKRTPDGNLAVVAGNGQEGFSGDGGSAAQAELDRPRSVAVEADGDVLIADTGNDRIREVIHGSNVIETIAGSGDYYGFSGDGGPATRARLSLPWSIAIGPAGTIYVADAGNNRVRSIDAKGRIATVVHDDLNAPTGVAVSASGDLYVVDLGDHWLRRIHTAQSGSAA